MYVCTYIEGFDSGDEESMGWGEGGWGCGGGLGGGAGVVGAVASGGEGSAGGGRGGGVSARVERIVQCALVRQMCQADV